MTRLVRTTFDLETEQDWLHIVPAGPLVVARDGRAFQLRDPQAVIARTERPVLVDWEHASEKWDGSTEAAGWGEELVSRSNGMWMRTAFTPRGRADIDSRAYRYVSPVLVLDEDRNVTEIASVALTNRPALRLLEAVTSPDAYRTHVRGLRMACSTQRQPSRQTAEEFIAQREHEYWKDSNEASVNRRLLRRGMTPAEIKRARDYLAGQRGQ